MYSVERKTTRSILSSQLLITKAAILPSETIFLFISLTHSSNNNHPSQRRNQSYDVRKFSAFNSLANVSAFSWIMAADNGTFWLRILWNQLKMAFSTNSKLTVLNVCRLMLVLISSESKSFSLWLTQGHLCYSFPFPNLLRAWHFSRNVLWLYLRFPATNIFIYDQQTKNKQMIVHNTTFITLTQSNIQMFQHSKVNANVITFNSCEKATE